jgi:hypothetical protein
VKRAPKKQKRELVHSSFQDAITDALNGEDARLVAVIDEIEAAFVRGDANGFMEALFQRVNWNVCELDALRSVAVALFATTNDPTAHDETRMEKLSLLADDEHRARCACCAERDAVQAASDAVVAAGRRAS